MLCTVSCTLVLSFWPGDNVVLVSLLLLECRVYRGAVTPQEDPGMYFTSHGGTTSIQDIQVHAMGPIWTRSSDQPAKTFEPAQGKSSR